MADEATKKAADEIANALAGQLDARKQKANEQAKLEEDAKLRQAQTEARYTHVIESAYSVLNNLREQLSGKRDIKANVSRNIDEIVLDGNRVKRMVRLQITAQAEPDYGRKPSEDMITVEIGIARGRPRGPRPELVFVYSAIDFTGATAVIRREIDPTKEPQITAEKIREILVSLTVDAVKQ